jgi:vanadium chloroperoxidase
MAMADAGITAWKEKYIHNLWRPVIGVREAGADFGPGACAGMPATLVADPFWRPLGSPASNTRNPSFTPGFPAYPSGHATFGTATFETVRDFYYPGLPSGLDPNGIDPKARAVRDASDIAFEFISDELNGKTMDADGSLRTLHRRALTLSKSIDENKRSRVFLGVHWQFDADWGDEIGLNIAAAAKTAL